MGKGVSVTNHVNEFNSLLSENGIRMLKTIPETPQQNGVAERMNRTLNERAKSMRIHAGLPKTFWADVVSTTTYLINLGPSILIGFKIPEEEWQSKDVSLSHLKVFGFRDADREKLDPQARKCIVIGYGENDMGYRFWNDQNRKIIRSKDVTFNENAM
uniref:Retrovirus-related Pol polyprotein from transposon TNT 1-94 n=1 Tax=Cajanus cajan TaxID=3821 RepID=A0A151UB19_CAJCA|nr:Retrovirus-related Pol polyprotein from transposon TNT 1-94 [Cajanus cajan]